MAEISACKHTSQDVLVQRTFLDYSRRDLLKVFC